MCFELCFNMFYTGFYTHDVFSVTDYVFSVLHTTWKGDFPMRYISGHVKKGRKTYYYVKDTQTGSFEKSCTKYLKHKILQNRSLNTVNRIAYTLSYYMNFLSEQGTHNDGCLPTWNLQTSQSISTTFWCMWKMASTPALTGKWKTTQQTPICRQYLVSTISFTGAGELPYLNVLDDRNFSYVSPVGTNVSATYTAYDGYLRSNEHQSRVATKEDIELILSACKTTVTGF